MSASHRDSQLIGDSAELHFLRAQITRVAASDIPILIEGPTGSGKELVAQALHAESGRTGLLVAVNVCAIADTMFEDAMFGHVRGAFSGAIGEHGGHLIEAHRGTVFLDEIGGLPLGAQIKLLRALETREFRPVGARNDRSSDFRLVTATNVPLSRAVATGAFRPDLAFRLSGAAIRVPALAAHPEDIPAIARHFAERAAAQRGISVELSDGALTLLSARPWPGNVRELKHVVQCLVAFATSSRIGREEVVSVLGDDREVDRDDSGPFERRRLLDTLRAFAWDTARTADHLGIHQSSIYRRVRRLGIDIRALRSDEAAGVRGTRKAGALTDPREGLPSAM
jgi:DNA-binding NtrC family response regulator